MGIIGVNWTHINACSAFIEAQQHTIIFPKASTKQAITIQVYCYCAVNMHSNYDDQYFVALQCICRPHIYIIAISKDFATCEKMFEQCPNGFA